MNRPHTIVPLILSLILLSHTTSLVATCYGSKGVDPAGSIQSAWKLRDAVCRRNTCAASDAEQGNKRRMRHQPSFYRHRRSNSPAQQPFRSLPALVIPPCNVSSFPGPCPWSRVDTARTAKPQPQTSSSNASTTPLRPCNAILQPDRQLARRAMSCTGSRCTTPRPLQPATAISRQVEGL